MLETLDFLVIGAQAGVLFNIFESLTLSDPLRPRSNYREPKGPLRTPKFSKNYF